MRNLIGQFLADENGATSIEYAMLASLIAVVIISAVNGLGSKVKGSYTLVSSVL